MSGYIPGVAPSRVITVNVDAIDPEVLAAAGLHPGQPVVAEPTPTGVLLRAASDDEVAQARGDQQAARTIREVAERHPDTIRRLGS